MLQVCEFNMKNRASETGPTKREKKREETKVEPPKQRDFTPEDSKMVKSILTKHDYYEVLGINKDATEAQIKKSYRKVSQQVLISAVGTQAPSR